MKHGQHNFPDEGVRFNMGDISLRALGGAGEGVHFHRKPFGGATI